MTQMQEQNKPKCICNDAKILGVGDDAIWTQGLAICLSTDSNKFAKHKRPLEQQKTGTKTVLVSWLAKEVTGPNCFQQANEYIVIDLKR